MKQIFLTLLAVAKLPVHTSKLGSPMEELNCDLAMESKEPWWGGGPCWKEVPLGRDPPGATGGGTPRPFVGTPRPMGSCRRDGML